jgi:hypothetical protein
VWCGDGGDGGCGNSGGVGDGVGDDVSGNGHVLPSSRAPVVVVRCYDSGGGGRVWTRRGGELFEKIILKVSSKSEIITWSCWFSNQNSTFDSLSSTTTTSPPPLQRGSTTTTTTITITIISQQQQQQNDNNDNNDNNDHHHPTQDDDEATNGMFFLSSFLILLLTNFYVDTNYYGWRWRDEDNPDNRKRDNRGRKRVVAPHTDKRPMSVTTSTSMTAMLKYIFFFSFAWFFITNMFF